MATDSRHCLAFVHIPLLLPPVKKQSLQLAPCYAATMLRWCHAVQNNPCSSWHHATMLRCCYATTLRRCHAVNKKQPSLQQLAMPCYQ
eukprot:2332759-Rhodomonas_salina.1